MVMVDRSRNSSGFLERNCQWLSVSRLKRILVIFHQSSSPPLSPTTPLNNGIKVINKDHHHPINININHHQPINNRQYTPFHYLLLLRQTLSIGHWVIPTIHISIFHYEKTRPPGLALLGLNRTVITGHRAENSIVNKMLGQY